MREDKREMPRTGRDITGDGWFLRERIAFSCCVFAVVQGGGISSV